MTAIQLRAALWLLLAIGIVIACCTLFSGHNGIPLQTNLITLLPATERNPVAEQAIEKLATATGNRTIFLIGERTPETAAVAARNFAMQLRKNKSFRLVIADIPPIDQEQLTNIYLQYRFNLLSDHDRGALSTGQADLEQRLQRKLYAPFHLGLTLPLADDPFGLTDNWLGSLPFTSLKLTPDDGLLVTQSGHKTWVFVSAELVGSAYASETQRSVVQAVAEAENTLHRSYPATEILRSGTVFYANAARVSAEHEVDLIGTGSLIGILLLLYFVFRSLRPLALGLISVGFGITAAIVTTVCAYGEMHLITLVFGASLIGEAIDYAIQYFAAHLGSGAKWEPLAGLRRITPGLIVALITSILGYGALMLAPFPALSQIALFALVGLSSAWLSVFLLLPMFLARPNRRNPETAVALPQRLLVWWRSHMGRRACLTLVGVLLVLAIPGWLQLQGNDDIRLLVTRSPALAAQEEHIRELTGLGNSSQFFLIEGTTPDEVMVNEERLIPHLTKLAAQGAITTYQNLSIFVPSTQRQLQNYALWQHNIFADETKLRDVLARAGLRDEIADQQISAFKAAFNAPLRLDNWLKVPVSTPYRHLWQGKTEHGFASVVLPQGIRDVSKLSEAAADLPGVTLVDKAGSVSRVFHQYRQGGALWLLGAIVLVYSILCIRYGWFQGIIVLAPTVLAMVLALSVFGYIHVPLTLFNIMGLMLVLGVGVNYAIFLREGGVNAAATLAGVLLSGGTTLLSFGLLTFSSMPALSGFGLTLLTGISIAVLLAPMTLSFDPKKTT